MIAVLLVAALVVLPAARGRRVDKPAREADAVLLVEVLPALPQDWAPALTKAAASVALPGGWAPPPPMTLAEARTALGCDASDDACVALIASTSGARAALVVRAVAQNDGARIEVAFIARDGTRPQGTQTLVLPDLQPPGLELAAEFVTSVASGKLVAFLDVRAQPGVALSIDGKTIGTAPLARPVALPPGPHAIDLTLIGHASVHRELSLQAGELLVETVTLAPSPARTTPSAAVAAAHGDGAVPWYIGGGVVAASSAVAIVGAWLSTTWVSASLEANSSTTAADACLGLCLEVANNTFVGPGVAGRERGELFAVSASNRAGGHAPLYVAGSLATAAVGLIGVGIGVFLVVVGPATE